MIKILVELDTPVAEHVATAVEVPEMLGRSTEHVPNRTWLILLPDEPTLAPNESVVVPDIVVIVDDDWEMNPEVPNVANPPRRAVDEA